MHDDDPGDLSLLLAPAAGEPAPAPVDQHLAAGRAALRRRRVRAAAVTLVALVLAGTVTTTAGTVLTAAEDLADPAGPARPTLTRSPEPAPDPAPDPAPSRPAKPTAIERPPGPDVIGRVRTATGAEAVDLRRFGNQRAGLSPENEVLLAPGWEVLQRIDDPAPVSVLNRRVNPDTIVDAVALAVARRDRPSGSGAEQYYLLDADANGLGSSSWEPVTSLTGSLSWWTTQQVYPDTTMSNGTPGADVELLGDGTLQARDGAQVLEELRDPDTGRYLPEEQTLTVAARVRVEDGRELFAIATQGPAYSATTWFSPTEPVADLEEFLALLRDVHGERP